MKVLKDQNQHGLYFVYTIRGLAMFTTCFTSENLFLKNFLIIVLLRDMLMLLWLLNGKRYLVIMELFFILLFRLFCAFYFCTLSLFLLLSLFQHASFLLLYVHTLSCTFTTIHILFLYLLHSFKHSLYSCSLGMRSCVVWGVCRVKTLTLELLVFVGFQVTSWKMVVLLNVYSVDVEAVRLVVE